MITGIVIFIRILRIFDDDNYDDKDASRGDGGRIYEENRDEDNRIET